VVASRHRESLARAGKSHRNSAIWVDPACAGR
jgi:hypothetical protein